MNIILIVQRTVVLGEGKEELNFREAVLLWKEKLGNKLNSIH